MRKFGAEIWCDWPRSAKAFGQHFEHRITTRTVSQGGATVVDAPIGMSEAMVCIVDIKHREGAHRRHPALTLGFDWSHSPSSLRDAVSRDIGVVCTASFS